MLTLNVNAQTKTIFSNIVALFTLQGLQYLIPLILLPYLVQTLGIEYFGLLAFATATIAFFRSTVAYGFDFTGTKQIALKKEHKHKLESILSSILAVKLLLVFITLTILMLMMITVEKISIEITLCFYTFFVFLRDWLF